MSNEVPTPRIKTMFQIESRTVYILEANIPVIVTLCGSTRFLGAFVEANLQETLDGKLVFSIGCDIRSDHEIFASMAPEERASVKAKLDELHLRKIDLSDEILVLNVGGYIGESTAREIAYARNHGKRIRYLEESRE